MVKSLFNGWLREALFELVLMVSVEVPAVVPVMLTEVGERLQVTPLPLPVTAQVRGTFPVNPLDGVTEIMAVTELPAAVLPEVGFALRVKVGVGGAVTMTVTVVVSLMGPEASVPVPMTVTVYVPGVVVLVLATVSVEVAELLGTFTELELRLQVAGLVAPLGPATEQERLIVPVKLFVGDAVITEVLPVVAPAVRFRLDGAALSVNPGVVEPPLTTASIARVWT